MPASFVSPAYPPKIPAFRIRGFGLAPPIRLSGLNGHASYNSVHGLRKSWRQARRHSFWPFDSTRVRRTRMGSTRACALALYGLAAKREWGFSAVLCKCRSGQPLNSHVLRRKITRNEYEYKQQYGTSFPIM